MKPQLPDRDDLQGPDDEGEKQLAPDTLAEFDAWMDRELEKLVARWSPWAAPNADQAERRVTRRR